MPHRWMVLFTTLVLLSLLIAPVHTVQAQDITPDCPPYDPGLLQEKEALRSLPRECIKTYKELARQGNPLKKVSPDTTARDVQSMVTGGPDSFGYTYDDSVSYNWISAATNSGLTGDDDFTDPIDIGFDFPFYGVPQSQLYFNTNGLITFGAGSLQWGAYDIPNDLNPNNFIAPFWDDLLVGAPDNSGAIYYSQGGSAPNRYFVIEWRDVQNYSSTDTFSFEAILYENGDFVVQHQSLPYSYYSSVGLEDSAGYGGLEYQFGDSGLTALHAIRFYYPTTPAANVLASAPQWGGFVPLSGHKDFTIEVVNRGSLGTDTYDLSLPASSWPVTYYASNGTTLLTDTDGDSVIDTGAIPQGTPINIIARYSAPTGAKVGDTNFNSITFTSSLDVSKQSAVAFTMSIPAAFAQVFEDDVNGAMSFMTVNSTGAATSKATDDDYFGYDVATALLSDGNYFYTWTKGHSSGSNWVRDIEYALIAPNGTIVHPAAKVTDNSGMSMDVQDNVPSVAVAPNGTLGVAWFRYIYNTSTDQYNYNIYFATLNSSGALLAGPTNITNNTIWGDTDSFNIPRFFSPTIAASSDNRFVISWTDDRDVSAGNYEQNIWYAVRNTAGASLLAPTALTSNDMSWNPVLNSVNGGKVILTWLQDVGGPYYAIINSGGSISKPAADLGSDTTYWSPDAIQLPNGKVAVAWATDSGVQYSILNSSYNIESGPHNSFSPYFTPGDELSVTTDASSHVIMTWIDASNYNKQLYALADSAGVFLTDPMYYNMSADYINGSWNGQGNAPSELLPMTGGMDTTGVFRPMNGLLYLKNKNETGFAELELNYGIPGDYPVVGDWDGDGTVTIGVYRNGQFMLRNSNTVGFADAVFAFGQVGDQPVAGDWNGDGIDTIGVYRPSTGQFLLRNSNDAGPADKSFYLGNVGDVGIAGDWDGDGMDTVGVFRPINGIIFLKNTNETGFAEIALNYGIPGDKPVTGDWNNDGIDTIGVYRNGQFMLRDSNTVGFADYVFGLGNPGDMPIAGNWDGVP